jgi:hypothetical protein
MAVRAGVKTGREMNSSQKTLLLVGVVAMFGMGLFPPWTIMTQYNSPAGKTVLEEPGDYSLIWEPPSIPKSAIWSNAKIDFSRLLIQWAAVAFVIAGGLFFFKEEQKNSE